MILLNIRLFQLQFSFDKQTNKKKRCMFLCLNPTASPRSIPPRRVPPAPANAGCGVTLTAFSLKSPRCLLRSPDPALSPARTAGGALAQSRLGPLGPSARSHIPQPSLYKRILSTHVLSPAARLLFPESWKGGGPSGWSSQFERAGRPPANGMTPMSPETANAGESRINACGTVSLFLFDMFLLLNTGSFP